MKRNFYLILLIAFLLTGCKTGNRTIFDKSIEYSKDDIITVTLKTNYTITLEFYDCFDYLKEVSWIYGLEEHGDEIIVQFQASNQELLLQAINQKLEEFGPQYTIGEDEIWMNSDVDFSFNQHMAQILTLTQLKDAVNKEEWEIVLHMEKENLYFSDKNEGYLGVIITNPSMQQNVDNTEFLY